jgi:hypothetical protein
MRNIKRAASRESPPTAKKSSSRTIWSRLLSSGSSRDQISASRSSVAPRGGVPDPALSWSGAGRAVRSTLPLALRGSRPTALKLVGIR